MCRTQVVRVDSATHVTIKLLHKPLTYSSDSFRLRHMTPPVKLDAAYFAAAKVALATTMSTHAELILRTAKIKAAASPAVVEDAVLLDGKPLESLKKLVGAQYPQLADIKENPQALRGKPLFERFAAAMEATAETHAVRFVLHGTPEQNIPSVLASGLRGRACGTRWFTSNAHTAAHYAQTSQRIVVCAVLVQKSLSPAEHIVTVNQDAHHLPLFVARRNGF